MFFWEAGSGPGSTIEWKAESASKLNGFRGSKWSPGWSVDQLSQIRVILFTTNRIRIKLKSRIRIRVKVKSWIRIRIKVMRIRNRILLGQKNKPALSECALIIFDTYGILYNTVENKNIVENKYFLQNQPCYLLRRSSIFQGGGGGMQCSTILCGFWQTESTQQDLTCYTLK